MKLQLIINNNVTANQLKDLNVYESFLVSQLKKQNRELKQEMIEKERLVEHTKRNLKLTKITEMEVELHQYIQECNRLR